MSQPIRVDVKAERTNGRVQFSHTWRSQNGPDETGAIRIPPGQSKVRIQFHLHDDTKLNLQFFGANGGSAGDAFWVDASQCPKEPSENPQTPVDQFQVTARQLTIVDRNSGAACTLHFTLRFDGDRSDEGPPYEYDPEIRNGGGGIDN